MIRDIGTVFWKEWREMAHRRGLHGWIGALVFMLMAGVLVPLQMGDGWVSAPYIPVVWGWIPLFLVSSVIADSVAGERERHTLETLLASRLPDRAILFGKLAGASLSALVVTWLTVLLGLVTVNLADAGDDFLFYRPTVLLIMATISVASSLLAASAGLLISLRAPTVRQAQQTLSVFVMTLVFAPVFGIQALPAALQAKLARLASEASVDRVVIAIVVLVALTDLPLLLLAVAGFRRSRLMMD